MRKFLIYVFFIVIYSYSCQEDKINSSMPSNIILNWHYSVSLGCGGDTTHLGDPLVSHILKLENKSDSVLLMKKILHYFFLGEKKLVFFTGGLEVHPQDSGIIELMDFLPRVGKFDCDTARFSEIRNLQSIELVKKPPEGRRNDSIYYSKYITKEDKVYIPIHFIIKKSKDYKFYPIGE